MTFKRPKSNGTDTNYLKKELLYSKKLYEISNIIHSAANLDEILETLKNEIASLLGAQRIIIYFSDKKSENIVSHHKTGDEIPEIRIPISSNTIAGYSALKKKLVNIKSVYDKSELEKIDEELKFDHMWDKKTGFITKQALANPIIHNDHLVGVIELINRKDGDAFSQEEERSVIELSNILGIAIHNQRRLANIKPTKYDFLLENNILTTKELEKAIIDSRKRKIPIEKVLINDLNISKNQIGESIGKFYNLPFVEYDPLSKTPDNLLENVKTSFMRKNFWVPIKKDNKNITIAIDNPKDLQKVDLIRSLFRENSIDFCVSLQNDILDFINLFSLEDKTQAGIDEILSQMKDEAKDIKEDEAVLGEEDSAVVQLINTIIIDAENRNASDIHFEPYPGKQDTHVRLRVDGNCYLYRTIPYHYKNAVVSRIKIMSDLDIAERRKPQDGRIRFKKFGGKDIELRVVVVPIHRGMEDVVIRVLKAGRVAPLDEMCFMEKYYRKFSMAITKPHGLIFVCGPTGSGKTTTLHSALDYINKPKIKIWTAEDPVEITQPGLRQVQVKPKIGFDFASAMRAFLRADPDVIMVGEMRDKETTQIGIEASLTGHLVLSTLHTNSAPESITRLLDMGMDPFNFADAILCILAQRLVPTLCNNCKKAYNPSISEYDELVREYDFEAFKKHLNLPHTKDLTLYKPIGCNKCNRSGYKGRIAIHELLMGTDKIKKMIQTKAPIDKIREQAVKEGMITLKQDGITKVFIGHCDLIHVRKVTI